MSATPRKQRRQLQKLGHRIDLVSDGDRLFFARHPQRSYRVRLSASVELDEIRIGSGCEVALPDGARWFTVVRQIRPGCRIRVFARNAAIAETDLGEDEARKVFETIAARAVQS